MSVVDKLRSFAESREAPDVVCCGLTYRDIREAHATIADLRDRLRVLAPMVCEGCGCARAVFANALCVDCEESQWGIPRGAPVGDWGDRVAACVSAGLRALCGRRLLDGCDTTKGGE